MSDTTYKPGWSAKELAELPVTIRISMMIRTKQCSSCFRYIDNRNFKRHATACLRKKRGNA